MPFVHNKGEIELAVKAVADDPSDRGTLFTLAIASGKAESIYSVREIIGKVLSNPSEVSKRLAIERKMVLAVSMQMCEDCGSILSSVNIHGFLVTDPPECLRAPSLGTLTWCHSSRNDHEPNSRL